jgi:hypothetical protein
MGRPVGLCLTKVGLDGRDAGDYTLSIKVK